MAPSAADWKCKDAHEICIIPLGSNAQMQRYEQPIEHSSCFSAVTYSLFICILKWLKLVVLQKSLFSLSTTSETGQIGCKIFLRTAQEKEHWLDTATLQVVETVHFCLLMKTYQIFVEMFCIRVKFLYPVLLSSLWMWFNVRRPQMMFMTGCIWHIVDKITRFFTPRERYHIHV